MHPGVTQFRRSISPYTTDPTDIQGWNWKCSQPNVVLRLLYHHNISCSGCQQLFVGILLLYESKQVLDESFLCDELEFI